VLLVRPGSPALRVPAATVDGATTVDATMPAASGGPAPGTLRLADAADGRWRATGDGRPLTGRPSDGWAQAFDVPAGVSHVTVAYDSARSTWLWVEGAVLLVVVVLALPTRRRQLDDDELSDLPDPGPARPHMPVAPSGAGRHAKAGDA